MHAILAKIYVIHDCIGIGIAVANMGVIKFIN